jgi:hypothetical protein
VDAPETAAATPSPAAATCTISFEVQPDKVNNAKNNESFFIAIPPECPNITVIFVLLK